MNKKEYNQFRNSVNPIDELVYFAASEYKKLREKYGLTTGDGECWEGDPISYNEDHIVTEWEYSWQYGGHSEGTCEIPLDAILGSKSDRLYFIESVVKKEYSKTQSKLKKKDSLEKEKRKNIYNELKKEFE